ncbi:MAG: hypothetical protein U5L11_14115 [Arhodomonas sp.]|nr:hypothetical protein [Arhodomonas sp.]
MQAGPGHQHETGRFTLPRNFRSTERLVQAVDALSCPQRPFVFEESKLAGYVLPTAPTSALT